MKVQEWTIEVWWPEQKESAIWIDKTNRIVKFVGKRYANMRIDKVLKLLGAKTIKFQEANEKDKTI